MRKETQRAADLWAGAVLAILLGTLASAHLRQPLLGLLIWSAGFAAYLHLSTRALRASEPNWDRIAVLGMRGVRRPAGDGHSETLGTSAASSEQQREPGFDSES